MDNPKIGRLRANLSGACAPHMTREVGKKIPAGIIFAGGALRPAFDRECTTVVHSDRIRLRPARLKVLATTKSAAESLGPPGIMEMVRSRTGC